MPNVVGVDTLLSGDLPTQAVNYSSLAAHAAKTQADWEDEITGAESNRWGGSSGVLGGLFQGLSQGKPFVAALIEAILHQVFEPFTDLFSNADDALVSLSSNFSGKWRDIIAAKDSADYANSQLAVVNRNIKDFFDSAAGNLSASWDIDYYDSVGGLAGGTVKQDGKGNAWWNGFGIAARTGRCRYNADTTTTDNQIVTIVMPLSVQKPALGGQKSHTRLLARVNSTGTEFVYAEVTNDSIAIGASVSGSETQFASTSTATQDGDVWDFIVGSATNDYLLKVKRNGVVILDYDDTGHVSRKTSGHRWVGFQMRAASRGIIGQTSPGTIAVFSATDQ